MPKVEMVQIGLTVRCNSNCYFCLREEMNRKGKESHGDFPIEGIKKIIDQGIKDIHLCGNRGEAIFHPEIEKIIDMIKSNGCRFEMNTNGGRFDTNWWYDLGQKMTKYDEVVFALDGLKNAHEFYRRTKWKQVYNNMKAFIEGGGDAVWQMILFKHNENQVNIVQNLAKEIGCKKTWILNSRMYNAKYQRPSKGYTKTKTDIVLGERVNKVECKFFNGKRVYIDVYGQVWPCCYMKCHFGFGMRKGGEKFKITKMYQDKREYFNVLNTSLDEIVSSNYFKMIYKNQKIPYPEKNILNAINYSCLIHCNTSEEMSKNRRRKIL